MPSAVGFAIKVSSAGVVSLQDRLESVKIVCNS
jgi:hypothetical protein